MPQILLIEDDHTLRRALRLTLEKIGHPVAEAGDGREGMQIVDDRPVDLVVTDLIMPGMEGLETIRKLRALFPSLPIIAITAGGRGTADGHLHMAEKFGAAKVFAKPFDFGELCEAVAILWKQRPGPAQPGLDP